MVGWSRNRGGIAGRIAMSSMDAVATGVQGRYRLECVDDFENRRGRDLARDTENQLVFLAESRWMLKMAQDNHPQVEFHFTSEF